MATFDSKQYLEAVEPPTFIDPTGVAHVGRILSVDEWTPLEEQLRETAKQKDWQGMQRAMLKMVNAFFPRPWYRWFAIGKKRWTVERWVRSLPPIIQMKAIWSFMQSQGKALGVKLEAPPGTRWSSIAETGGRDGGSQTAT